MVDRLFTVGPVLGMDLYVNDLSRGWGDSNVLFDAKLTHLVAVGGSSGRPTMGVLSKRLVLRRLHQTPRAVGR